MVAGKEPTRCDLKPDQRSAEDPPLRWETQALRAKGLCGAIVTDDGPQEHACLLPLGHGPHGTPLEPYWTLDEAGNAVMDLLTQDFPDVEQRRGPEFIEAITKLIQRARRRESPRGTWIVTRSSSARYLGAYEWVRNAAKAAHFITRDAADAAADVARQSNGGVTVEEYTP